MKISRFVLTAATLISTAAISRADDPVLLQLDATNLVSYVVDTPEVSKYGTLAGPVIPVVTGRPFQTAMIVGDIVAVNGKPAKGFWLARSFQFSNSPTPVAGQNIADISRSGFYEQIFEVLQPDGSSVGTLYSTGMSGGPLPPGAPASFPTGAYAVTGGTGAWFGVRGETTNLVRLPEATVTLRNASATEDPANRRSLGGGGPVRIQFRLIPAERPAIVTLNGVPAIAKASDGKLISSSNAAAAGDVLTLYATGLGPVRPPPDPGQPFGSSPLQTASVPVEVTINGLPAEVMYAGGYPGTTDTYQINFRVPSGLTAGLGKVIVSSAWVPSVAAPLTIR
ncbi:MAG: hypothetical protein QOJ99_4092 [Bryobacterales bacterium]|nr:hypothetical protein [Bryobacterales bacterium]